MFSLYKKELQSYFLSPAAYAVLAFTLTFSLTMIMDISTATQLYEFSFTSLFYVNLFYLAILFPVLTMRSFAEERKNRDRNSAAIQPYQRHQNRDRKVFGNRYCLFDYAGDIIILPNYHRFKRTCHSC